jgi:hypothetical protein
MRHVIYYHPEPGGFVRAVETTLADEEKRERMALAARGHVLRYHSPDPLVDHVIESALAENKG